MTGGTVGAMWSVATDWSDHSGTASMTGGTVGASTVRMTGGTVGASTVRRTGTGRSPELSRWGCRRATR